MSPLTASFGRDTAGADRRRLAVGLLIAVAIEAGSGAAALWTWSSPEGPPVGVVANGVARKSPLAVMLYGGKQQQAAKVEVHAPPKITARKKVAAVAQPSGSSELTPGHEEAAVDPPPILAEGEGDAVAAKAGANGGESGAGRGVAAQGSGDDDTLGAPAAEQTGASLDGRDLSRYAVLILSELTANRRVPLQAVRMRLQGSTMLELSISGGGELAEVRVVKSSGHTVLDDAALQTVRDSAPFPPPPRNLVAKFTVPIRYVD